MNPARCSKPSQRCIVVRKNLTLLPWLPPLLTLLLVLAMHVDAPYHDQWDLLPLLHAHYEGTLQWRDLLQPHNGHILFLPKLVMLSLAITTQWNTLAEVLFGFACMLCNWLLLQQLAQVLLQRALSTIESTALSLLVFSLAQAQNWLWGWQLQIPLSLLFVLCGFRVLLSGMHPLAAMTLAVACGVAASCSFAGSLPYWIAIIPLLWQRQRLLLLPWLMASAAFLLLYARLLGLWPGAQETATLAAPFAIHTNLLNSLAVLGNLAARYQWHTAVLAGATACAITLRPCLQRPHTVRESLLLSLVLFSVGSALLVSLLRTGLGSDQMLASRYGTLTLPLWAACAALLPQRIVATRGMRVVALLLLASIVNSSVYSVKEFRQLHNRLQRGAIALSQTGSLQDTPALVAINPRADRQQALREVALLQHYRLSTFRTASANTAAGQPLPEPVP